MRTIFLPETPTMIYIILFAIIGGLAWINARIVRGFLRRRAGGGWWAALISAGLVGGAFGAWSGFSFEYRPYPKIRVSGAPIPSAFFHWEGPPGEGQWVDFVTTVPVFFAATNIPILALSAACLVGLMFRVGSAIADQLPSPLKSDPR